MTNIKLRKLPADLHGQLKLEAKANCRSVGEEALARLRRSFEEDDVITRRRDQRLVEEAIASGPEEPLTPEKLEQVRFRVLRPRG